MDTCYIDWSKKNLTFLWNNDDRKNETFSFDTLMDHLTEPSVLICETTFESYDLERRAAVAARAEREGHILLTTPNRLTGRERRAMGYGDQKTDEIDAHAIRHLAQRNPAGLKRVRIRSADDPLVTKLHEVMAEMQQLRVKTVDRKSRSKLGFARDSLKTIYAKKLIKHLPTYKTLTDTQKVALGNGVGYSPAVVAAIGKATKHARTRKEFDHFSGLFVHGYPTQIRSDLMFHRWWKFLQPEATAPGSRPGQITLSDFRRECRWLYHQLAQVREVL